ncbi:MAG: hypothetical protein L0Y32_03335 [Nevskiales bacterium]|nr:hypothetical protein [Nevskiales bacterium]
MSHLRARAGLYTGILVGLWAVVGSAYGAPRYVDPLVTGPGITAVPGPGDHRHLVYAPVTPQTGKLFVHLPGTHSIPDLFNDLLDTAADIGYHGVGLMYPNDESINEAICATDNGVPASELNACKEDVRVEIITGEDVTPYVDVDRANSIENRLIKLLEYLHQQYPSEGWDTYLTSLTGGAPKWDRIVVAGNSQGGGHAAMLGKLYRVARVNIFSSLEPATWTTEVLVTPASDYFGFVHTEDPRYGAFVNSWDNLQIPGPLTSIDGLLPPYGGSHQLESSVPVTGNGHSATASDGATPLDGNGDPLYRDVWAYMMTGEGGSVFPEGGSTAASTGGSAMDPRALLLLLLITMFWVRSRCGTLANGCYNEYQQP